MNAHGKVYLITGATDGIGLHTAQSLARLDAQVIVHGRSKVRVDRVVETLCQATGNKHVFGFPADFSSLAAVRQLADAIRQQHSHIDCLLNNAGVYMAEKRLSDDGLEMTWAVNIAAPFLLTSLLVDLVSERIINVSSSSAADHIAFDHLEQDVGHEAYKLASLANMLFTYQLASRLKAAGRPTTCNCLDPGPVGTQQPSAGWGPVGVNVKAANDALVVATDPHLARVSGAFFVSKSCWPTPKISYDHDT